LYDAVESYRKESGETKTDVLVKALSDYIKHPVNWPAISSGTKEKDQRLEAVEKEVQELNTKVHRLYEYIGSIAAQEPSSTPQNAPEGQMELEGIVITANNTHDNKNATQIEKTDNIPDNKVDNKKRSKHKEFESIPENAVFLNSLRTVEVLELPGFQNQSIEKIKNKIRNAKASGKRLVAVPPYFLELSEQTRRSERNGKLEALWNVYEIGKIYLASPGEASDTPSKELEGYQESHSQEDS
jgi:hypothetical protein